MDARPVASEPSIQADSPDQTDLRYAHRPGLASGLRPLRRHSRVVFHRFSRGL